MKRHWREIGVLAALVFVTSPVMAHAPHMAAAGVSAGESGGRAPQIDSAVTIQTFQFKPGKLEVKTGTKVTWTNQDDIRHTVTSGTPEKKDGPFDAPLAGKGTSFSFAFMEPGIYTYFCDRHQHMRGEVSVK